MSGALSVREKFQVELIFKQTGAELERHRSVPLTSCHVACLHECTQHSVFWVFLFFFPKLRLDLKAVISNTNVGFMRLSEENDRLRGVKHPTVAYKM